MYGLRNLPSTMVVGIAALTAACCYNVALAQPQTSPASTNDLGFRLNGSLLAPSSASDEEGGGAPEGGGRAHEDSLENINNKLNNPGADLASLNFKFVWTRFKGDLPDADSQDSVLMNFQPVFPFKLADGNHFIIRPSFPLTWSPSPALDGRGFEENFGLADMQVVGFYGVHDKDAGLIYGFGPTMQLPTHTDDSLGKDQLRLGPAAYVGLLKDWGSTGAFVQHWWNVGGSSKGYTSKSELNVWYWFNVGGGYQIGGSPIIDYDWAEDDSSEAWTVPVNLGVAKTIKIGKTPVKLKFEAVYYLEQPDAFGPEWGLQLTITPVIPNPFERHPAGASG
jgi:hypothetical protein